MKKPSHRNSIVLLSCIVIVAILLNGCGGSTTEAPPVVVGQNPLGNNGTYINLLINSLEFTGTVSNLGDTGNLQFIMVATDNSGHSDALICPYGAVIQVHRGDKINPCEAGLTYPSNLLQGNLNIMLIAVDIKDKSDLADVGTNLITSGLSTGLGAAIQGSSELSPELAIGLIALDTVIGYAGDKVQEYFQRNYVIGSQSFTMSSQYHWNNGQPVFSESSNQQVNFSFVVQQSTTASGQLFGSASTQAYPTQAYPTATEVLSNTTSNSSATISCTNISQVALRKSPGYLTKNDKKDIIYKIDCGQQVQLLGDSQVADGLTWWHVTWQGYTGWMADHTGSGLQILIFSP